MTLQILKDRYAVCKAEKPARLINSEDFFSVTVTKDEVSIVCTEKHIPAGCEVQAGFRAMRIKGILDFSLTGIIARISGILAQRDISIFVVSTYDTDYIFVKEEDMEKCVKALEENGYIFEGK